MKRPLTSLWNRCWQYCADYLRDALAAGPPAHPGRARRVRDSGRPESGFPDPCIELSIHPSGIPLCAAAVFLLAGLVHAGWLQYRGAPLPAAMVLLGVGAIARGLWPLLRNVGAAPRRLRLFTDGRATFHVGGVDLEARPAPCSLRLGRYTLMVFHAREGRRLRLLLGPEILSAQDRAALGRWLHRASGGEETGDEGTALDWPPSQPDRTSL